MKKIKFLIISGLLALPFSLSATGLSFTTTSSDILSDAGSALPSGALLRVGTLSSTAGSAVTDFEANFTQLLSTTANGTGDFTILSGAGTLAGNTDLYGIAYSSGSTGEQPAAVFLIGTTPAGLGLLIRNPSVIDGSGSMLLGSHDSTNIRLSPVPEPSAFALLAGCFGMAWVMVRRRV